MLAAVAVLSMTTFAACSSDDDPKKEEEKAKSGSFIYSFYLSDDALKVADITITYTDCNGKEIKETVTADKCSKDISDKDDVENGITMCYTKEITAASLPATSGYIVEWVRNASQLDKEKYNLSSVIRWGFKLDSESEYKPSQDASYMLGCNAASIDNLIKTKNKRGKKTYTANANGALQ